MSRSEYTFTWKIENFSFCHHSNGTCLHSPYFYPKIFENLMCSLRLYPRGLNEKYSDFLSCSLKLFTNVCTNFFQCDIKAIGASGKILKVHKWKDFSSETYWNTVLECNDFLTIENVVQDAEGSEEDTLTICCKLYGKKSNQSVSAEDIVCTKIGVNLHTFKLKVFREETMKLVFNFGGCPNFPTRMFKFSITETSGKLKITISRLDFNDVEYLEYVEEAGIDDADDETCVVDCAMILLKERYTENTTIYSKREMYYFSSENWRDWEFPTEILSEEWESHRNRCKNPYPVKFYCEFSVSNGTNLEFCLPESESTLTNKTDASTFSNKTDPSHASSATETYSSLQVDLLTLLHSKMLADVELRVGDEAVEAHKTVLVSRSPVFAGLFDQKEAVIKRHKKGAKTHSGIIDIVDIETHILKLFLQYLYTDTIDEMNYEVAKKLLMVAKNYQVMSLKEKCSVFLENEMSVENVCEILSLAYAVNHEYLKSASIEFIILNSTTVLSTPQWMTWMKSNMESANYIFSKLTRSLFPAVANTSGSSS